MLNYIETIEPIKQEDQMAELRQRDLQIYDSFKRKKVETVKELANNYDLSTTRIRQIVKNVERRLRNASKYKKPVL